MRLLRKRSKRNREQSLKKLEEEPSTAAEFNQSSPWKIVMMLLFLAVLAVLLLKNDEADSINGRKPRVIPNPEVPLPPSPSVLHTFKHAAVSSDSQVCSDIARDALKSGGNVFDGALSSLFCNSLTQIQSMGLLGGFLLTCYIKAEHRSLVVDAQMTSPKSFKNVTDVKQMIAAPGFLKGLWEIHKKHGSISWRNLVEPTLSLCKKGITISKHLKDSMHINKRIVKDPYLRQLFVDKEKQKFKRPGSKIIIDKQCKFLDIVANHTEADIYSGSVGEMIIKDFHEVGSFVTIKDLRDYKVRWSETIEFPLSDKETVLTPKTNPQSVLISSILNVLRKYNFNASSFDGETNVNETILTHHRIVEAFKHVFAVRSRLGDPDFIDVDDIVKHILSEDFAQDVKSKIDDHKTYHNHEHYSLRFATPEDHGTSHVSIIAANGDAISVTSSINYYFGAGVSGQRTGLIFNNGMDDFSYPHRAVNYFGLKETPTNYPEPGKRALSSMSPLIVVDKAGNVRLVIGAAGGSKIISALSLALIKFSCCTNSIKDIVDAPRFHHQSVPDEIEYEYGIINQVIEGLVNLGHKVRRFNNRGTIVNALTCLENEINGIADYRKDWSGVSGY